MKNYIRLTGMIGVCAAIVTTLPAPAADQEKGFYVNAAAGASLADSVDLKAYFGSTPGVKMDFDTGFSFGVAGGYNFNQFLSAELETGYIGNTIKTVTGAGSFDGSLDHIPLMANVVFRYDQPNSRFVPYLGAGIGGDTSLITLNYATANNVTAYGTDSTIVFAWQVFGGLRFKFNENMSLGAGYKYYSAQDASWDFAGFSNSIKIGTATVHRILVEFNMKF